MKFLERLMRKGEGERAEGASKPQKFGTGPSGLREPPAAVPTQNRGGSVRSASKTGANRETLNRLAEGADGGTDLRFELGDFLHRIPAHLLHAGPHDLKTPLLFQISDLSKRINKGQTTIVLSEIYKRVPKIFRGQILESDNIEIRFPWQKLARLVNISRDNSADGGFVVDPAAELLAERLRNRTRAVRALEQSKAEPESGAARTSTTRHVLPGHAPKGEASWFSRATVPEPGGTVNSRITAEEQAEKGRGTETPALVLLPKESSIKSGDSGHSGAIPIDGTVVTASEISVVGLGALSAEPPLGESVNDQHATVDSSIPIPTMREINMMDPKIPTTSDAAPGKDRDEASPLRAEGRIAQLEAERDALLRQKAFLSAQVSEFVNKRGGPARAGDEKTVASGSHDPERPRRDQHRQVEELQRRILTLESNQREAALELHREREVRIKLEKQLSAADKLAQETAAYMDQARAEIRREVEAEFRKSSRELTEALAARTAAVAERDDVIEGLRAELSLVRTSGSAEKDEAALAEALAKLASQERVIAGLGEEVDSYRSRIRAVIDERHALRAQLKQATETVAELSQSRTEAGIAHDMEASHRLIEELQDQLVAEREQKAVSSKAAEARLAELEKQHLAYRTEVESELIVLQDKIEGIVRERDRAVRDAAQLAEQRRCELEKHAEMLAAIEHEHTSVIRAREELAKRLTETERVRAQLESERYPEATSSGVLAELAALKVQLDAERARAREAASQLEEAQLGLEASAAVLRETEVRLASVSRSEADLRLELEAFVVSAAGTPNRDLSGGGDETAAAVVQGASEKCVREFEEPHLFGERGEAGAELELLPMPEEPLANGPRVRPKARPRQARLK